VLDLKEVKVCKGFYFKKLEVTNDKEAAASLLRKKQRLFVRHLEG